MARDDVEVDVEHVLAWRPIVLVDRGPRRIEDTTHRGGGASQAPEEVSIDRGRDVVEVTVVGDGDDEHMAWVGRPLIARWDHGGGVVSIGDHAFVAAPGEDVAEDAARLRRQRLVRA